MEATRRARTRTIPPGESALASGSLHGRLRQSLIHRLPHNPGRSLGWLLVLQTIGKGAGRGKQSIAATCGVAPDIGTQVLSVADSKDPFHTMLSQLTGFRF
jgi:hypothetical protein